MMLLFAALAMQTPGPLTGSWLTIHQGPQMTLAVDESTIARDGDLVRVRMRGDLAGNDGTRWGIALLELDCRSRTGRVTELHVYRADGTLVSSAPRSETDSMLAGPPGEEAGQFLDATCRRTGWEAGGPE